MRVILAGLFTFISTAAVAGAIGAIYPDDQWPAWATPMIIATLFGTMFGSLFLFNPKGLRPNITGKTLEEQIADLEAEGLIQRDSFTARRAFQVEESEDEGSHYYIELDDGRVLFLSGQYLYDFEEIADDPELNQPRSFPCTAFDVVRHRTEGFVINLDCKGAVLEPEILAPPFGKKDFKEDRVPEDGEVVDTPYDILKSERSESGPGE